MKPLKSTLKIAQVSGELEPADVTNSKWTIKSSFLACSCPNCRANPNNINNYIYSEHCLHQKDVVIAKGMNEENEDRFGLRQLKVKELRDELQARALTWRGLLKPQLVEVLTEALMKKHDD